MTTASENPELRERRDKAMEAMLRDFEYSGRGEATGNPVCPYCRYTPEQGHYPTCPLAVLLGDRATLKEASE